MYPNWILFNQETPPENKFILVTVIINNKRYVKGGCFDKRDWKIYRLNTDRTSFIDCQELIAWCVATNPF